MKIYKHTGSGHYIGSCYIIIEENLRSAKKKIREMLNNDGLQNEELDIEVFEVDKPSVILVDNGDY